MLIDVMVVKFTPCPVARTKDQSMLLSNAKRHV